MGQVQKATIVQMLYRYYRYTVATTVTPGVLQPSPLKRSHLEITKGERSMENKEQSLNHIFGLNDTIVGLINFLIPRSGICLQSDETCRQKQASMWGQH
jgi:hypothetical protein